jgi:hypothetical protein
MEVSILKSWVLVPSTESALPNSRGAQRGSVTLLSLSRPTKRNVLDEAMIASIPDTLSMADVNWLRRSNWPDGSRSKHTERLRYRGTAAAHRAPARTVVF